MDDDGLRDEYSDEKQIMVPKKHTNIRIAKDKFIKVFLGDKFNMALNI